MPPEQELDGSSEVGSLAIVVLPDNTCNLKTIQQIRATHDKAAPKWPPHVTLIPANVLPPSRITAKQLSDLFQQVSANHAPFHITLDAVSVFSHGSSSFSVVLQPSNKSEIAAITLLQSHISSLLPESCCSQKPLNAFNPHLTLATCKSQEDATTLSTHLKKVLGEDGTETLSFRIDAISIMSKLVGRNTVYSCIESIQLNNAVSPVPFQLPSTPHASALNNKSKYHLEPPAVTTASFGFNRGSCTWAPNHVSENNNFNKIQNSLKTVTYNVLDDQDHPTNYDAPTRFTALCQQLESTNADFIGLQEVNASFLSLLKEQAWVRERYFLSLVDSQVEEGEGGGLTGSGGILGLALFPFECKTVSLSKGKKAIIVTPVVTDVAHEIPANVQPSTSLKIAVVHFTSDYNGDRSKLRESQWKNLVKHLAAKTAIVLGDVNSFEDQRMETAFQRDGFEDVWTTLNPGVDGFSFDPSRNELAHETSRYGKLARYDQVLLMSEDWVPVSCHLIGESDGMMDLSDHYGIIGEFEFGTGTKWDGAMNFVDETISNRSHQQVLADCDTDPTLSAFLRSQNALPTAQSLAKRDAALQKLNNILRAVFYPAPWQSTLVGSTAMGTDTDSSDIDVLCISIISTADFFKILQDNDGDSSSGRQQESRRHPFKWPINCKLIRVVESAKVPIAEISVDGVKIDIQYGCFLWSFGSPASGGAASTIASFGFHSLIKEGQVLTQQSRQLLCSYLDLLEINRVTEQNGHGSAFRLAVRVLKVWGKERGVTAGLFGFPSGYLLTVLAARVCREIVGPVTAMELVCKVFSYCSTDVDWSRPVEWELGKQHGGSLDMKTPMVVLSPSGVNICRGVVGSSRTVWLREIARCAQLGEDLVDICEPYSILQNHASYIHIEVCGNSVHQLERLKKMVELRFVNLVVQVQRRCPSIGVRPWGSWFVVNGNDPETSASLVVGLEKMGTEEISLSERKQVLGTLDNVILQFESEIQRLETYASGMWVHSSHVARSAVSKLVPAPAHAVSLFKAFVPLLSSEMNRADFIPFQTTSNSTSASLTKKGKLRSSEDVFNRILWDASFDRESFVVGYMDRFTGIQEMQFNEFARRKEDEQGEDWIPFHRIWYFKKLSHEGDKVVWDRKHKLDLIFE
ncbi:2'-5' RNA ligase superfamily-domain-containing protein [Obelidium mucronatum]|nr:2'-5' RNA ligase superfamily-domain-containing protein [Obelidium mucronatum]